MEDRVQRSSYTPPSPEQGVRFQNCDKSPTTYTKPDDIDTPPPSTSLKPTGVRFSDRHLLPKQTKEDLSPVDQQWGSLFNIDGKPTQRLGQVLRGLANYIVSCFDYALKQSTNKLLD
jgi:hypothetical protein